MEYINNQNTSSSTFSSPAKSVSAASSAFSSPAKSVSSTDSGNFFRLTYKTGEAELEFNTRPKAEGGPNSWKKVSIYDETIKREFINVLNYWLSKLDTKEVEYEEIIKAKERINTKNLEIKTVLSRPDLPQADITQHLQDFIVYTTNWLSILGTHDEKYIEEVLTINANNEAIARAISEGDFSQENKNRVKIYIDSTNKCLSTLSTQKIESEAICP